MYARLTAKLYLEEWAILESTHWAMQDSLAAYFDRPADVRAPISLQQPFTPMAIAAGLRPPSERSSRVYTAGSLAVIPVRGIIASHLSSLELSCGAYGLEQLQSDIGRVEADSSVKRVLFDFHSPGGSITQLPETAKALRNMTKDTYGFTTGQSASASYWLMSQANHVYMAKSASVGSIGVYMAILDQSEAAKQRGLRVDIIRNGKFKGTGAPGHPISEEERAMYQERVDTTAAAFRTDVKRKRKVRRESDMQGQMFTGDKARELGFVDAFADNLSTLVSRLS